MADNLFDDFDNENDLYHNNASYNDTPLTNPNLQQASDSRASTQLSKEDEVIVNRQNLELVQPVNKLGEGSYGEVYLYRDKFTNRRFAVKIMKQEPNKIITNQYELMRKINHKGLNKVYAQFTVQVDNKIWIVNQYDPDFTSLKQELKNGPFNEEDFIVYSRDALQTLDFLHQNDYIHRDIKADNALVNLEKKEIRFIDFDTVVKVSRDNPYVKDFVGTPNFMSPELFNGKYTVKTDMFSLGGMFLEMLGYPPWHSMDVNQIYFQVCDKNKKPDYPSNLNPQIRDILDRCFEFDPVKRSSANELLQQPIYDLARSSRRKKF